MSWGLLSSVKYDKIDCLSCSLGKHQSFSFHDNLSVSSTPFDLIDSNI